jgi:PAS domain S-box-containing protein
MSISSKLKIAALVPGLLALVIGLAFLFSYRVLDRAREEGQRTKQLISSMNELNSLARYFILHHEDRPRRQFLSEHDSMMKLIGSLRFRDKTQQKILEGIRHNSESLMKAFLRLVAVYEGPAPAESYALSSEAEERLEGRILTASRDLVSNALRLEVLIDGEIATTQRRVSWLVLFVLLGTSVPLTFVLIRIMRRISESLAILRQGTEAVGAGHLDYRIGIAARDEIGDLSRAFDLMTERLKDTTVSRDSLRTEVEERKRAEEEVRRQGEWLRVILSSIGDAVMATDDEGRVSFLNPVAVNLTGWQLEEARGQSIQSVFRIINEQTCSPADDIVKLVLREGKVVNLANHTTLIHRDGREIPIEDSAAPIRDAEGNAVGVVIVFHDVTEKRRAQEEILEAAEKFRIVADFTYDWEHWRMPDNHFAYVSPSCERITGYNREAFMQDPGLYTRIIHPDDRERMIAHMREDLCQREPCELELRIVRRDGRECWIGHSCRLVTDALGQPMGRRASNRDITKRKQAEESLRESTRRLALIVDSIADGFFALDREWRFIHINDVALRHFGKLREEVMGCSLFEIFPAVRDSVFETQYRRAMEGTHSVHFETASMVTDKTMEVHAYPGLDGVTVLFQDITERIRITAALRENEAALRGILDATKESVWLFSPEGLVLMANKTAVVRLEKPFEEVIGRHFNEILPAELAQSRLARLREAVESRQPIEFEDARSGILFHHDFYPVLDEEGRVVSIASFSRDITERKRVEDALRKAHHELEIKVMERTSELADINEALQAEIIERTRAEEIGEAERHRFYDVLETLPAYVVLLSPDYSMPFANRFFRERFGESHGLRCYEYLFDRKEPCEGCETFRVMKTHAPHRWEWTGPDGRTYDVSDFPFTDTDGSTLIMEMGIDITERKRAEENLRSYMARLEQSNRDLEDFAHVASHDLQEPLRKIRTFSDLLIGLHHDSLNDTVRDYLERMNLAAERMHTLVMALLRYSRITSHLESYTVFNLREPVEEAMGDLGSLCEESEARVEIGKLPEVKADRDLIRQLFQNLIANALKYRGERKPVVRIYANAADSGLFWDIQVEDNGIGFDEVYIDKIFKPFQRLHGKSSPYKGTGMGLAICRKIVDRHGGIITARSTPGKGSTFIVSLPKGE